jgi:hypothetical protein
LLTIPADRVAAGARGKMVRVDVKRIIVVLSCEQRIISGLCKNDI